MRNTSFHRLLSAVGGLICAVGFGAPRANAASISLSTTTINPAANQTISVNISGSEQIAGSDLLVQVLDGGTDNTGTATKPTITNIDMLTGTIFASDNTGQSFFRSPDHLMAQDTVNTTSGGGGATTVSDNGLLATLTLDATGVAPGTFTIQFFNMGQHDPSFGNGASSDYITQLGGSVLLTGTGTSTPATITVTPEPMTASLMLLGIGGLALRRSRR